MATFESDHVLLKASCDKVYHFLSDFRNMESLMPSQITNWKATEDTCSFTIRGLADLSMELGSKSSCSNIHIVSKGKNPIDYSLDYFLSGKNDQCRVTVLLDAELNVFLKGIASRPLQNLVDMIADKLHETFQ